MSFADPAKILNKFADLHRKLGGPDRPITFVQFNNTFSTPFGKPTANNIITTPNPPAVVKDQPGKEYADAFAAGIGMDQRLFIFVADSFVPRAPLPTLSQRAESFLLERIGQNVGGIQYGNTLYVIKSFFVRPILGGVPCRYIILGQAHKKDNG